MQKTNFKKHLSLLLCAVLVAVTALVTTGCRDTNTQDNTDKTPAIQDNVPATVLGEGQTQFSLIVAGDDNTETLFEIHTDKETVGEALLELGVILGEESQYGLYIKTVNGITVDYNKDGKYWAFYIDGEYATSGVDQTQITQGVTYSLKIEK